MTALVQQPEGYHASLILDGRIVDGPHRPEVRNPGRASEIVGSFVSASSADVDVAVSAAVRAFQEWAAMPMIERADVLRAAAEALAEDADGRIHLLARENGQLLSEARGGVMGASRTLSWYADLAATYEVVAELPTSNGRVIVEKQPTGPTALIVPWNAPTRLGFLSLAPTLLAGNTVVVKLPSEAPLALFDSLARIHHLFPKGTVNVVSGSGSTVGRHLVSHPGIRRVSFTGSTATGKQILRLAANSIKRVSLELGGNDPAIVLPDADLDATVSELVRGAFALSGQMCYAVKRIYVHSSIYGEFVAAFRTEVDAIRVGSGLDARSTMGSMINARQRDRIIQILRQSEAAGAEVAILGSTLDGTEDGWFHLPAVVTGLHDESALVREEQFGPAIPVMSYETEAEAITRANDSEFGLASSVWTSDIEHGFDLGRKLEAGSTFINIHRAGASGDDMPFGGFKESGLGRGHGVVALDEQYELHTVSSRRPG